MKITATGSLIRGESIPEYRERKRREPILVEIEADWKFEQLYQDTWSAVHKEFDGAPRDATGVIDDSRCLTGKSKDDLIEEIIETFYEEWE